MTSIPNQLQHSNQNMCWVVYAIFQTDLKLSSQGLAMARRLLSLQKHYCTINSYRYHFLTLNQLSTVLCSNRTPCTLEDVYSRTSQTEQFLSLHTRRVEYHKVSTYYSSPESGSVFTIKSVYVLKPINYPWINSVQTDRQTRRTDKTDERINVQSTNPQLSKKYFSHILV